MSISDFDKLPNTNRFSKFFQRQTQQQISDKAVIEYPHHASNASLHYLVKCSCSSIAMHESRVKRTPMQDSAIQNNC